jgi:hypothetical protein
MYKYHYRVLRGIHKIGLYYEITNPKIQLPNKSQIINKILPPQPSRPCVGESLEREGPFVILRYKEPKNLVPA